ncbi:hypothetical protein QBC35DRAFT_466292 [Podospora australis]|uniref:Ankyrin n=1 Tax=Podospora australis TaxID=1536484 RepID=A0AAN7AG50_9PEZI|nr:hypothetical protein QBC35DRAFT_466292 [Podospora australis]
MGVEDTQYSESTALNEDTEAFHSYTFPSEKPSITASSLINDKVLAAFEQEPIKYWLDQGTSHGQDGLFFSMRDEYRTLTRLYGPLQAIALVLLCSRSVWNMQARVLGRHGPAYDTWEDHGQPDDVDPVDPDYKRATDSVAGEYNKTVEVESIRVSVTAGIIAAVSFVALAFHPTDSDVVRFHWLISFATSLLAIHNANNNTWKLNYLCLGNKLRAWIRGSNDTPKSILTNHSGDPVLLAKALLRSQTPSFSAVFTASTPGLFLSLSSVFVFLSLVDVLSQKIPKMSSYILLLLLPSLALLSTFSTRSNETTIRDTMATHLTLIQRRSIFTPSKDKTTVSSLPASDRVISAITSLEAMVKSQGKGATQRLSSIRELLALSLAHSNPLSREVLERQDASGETALHRACYRGQNWTLVQMLASGNASVNVRDYKGRTPLMFAAKEGYQCCTRELLWPPKTVDGRQVEAADWTLKDADGKTAMDYAREKGKTKVISVLERKEKGSVGAYDEYTWETEGASEEAVVSIEDKEDGVVKEEVVGEVVGDGAVWSLD